MQHQNPTFFREFFLEHNLERFATNRYQHAQPFWYYFIVIILAVMPWTVIAIRALIDGIQTSVAEWRLRRLQASKRKPSRPGDAFPEFLVLWALIPIVFFSFSQSKLPGYILPSIPPITILTGDYLFRSRQPGLNRWELVGHAVALRHHDHVCACCCPGSWVHGPQMPPPRALAVAIVCRRRCGPAHRHRGQGLWCGTTCAWPPPASWSCWFSSFTESAPSSASPPSTPPSASFTCSTAPTPPVPSPTASNSSPRLTKPSPSSAFAATWNTASPSIATTKSSTMKKPACPTKSTSARGPRLRPRGVDLHTPAALEEYLEGRHYEQLFSWPEQGIEVYLVGSAESNSSPVSQTSGTP